MSITSVTFIFGILPIFLLIYYLSKPKYRIYILLISSIAFYYINEPKRLPFITAIIIINFLLSIFISHFKQVNKGNISKLVMIVGIIGNTSTLFLYKYIDFSSTIVNQVFHSNLIDKSQTMLVGQSFFTFALISYLVDVYTNKCSVQKNIIKFSSYVLMFPKIIMGPIARYKDMEDDFTEHKINPYDIGTGAKRFMCGFCKKVIIADNLVFLVHGVDRNFSNSTVVALWIASIAFSLQLFFDFSGYSDMAIGLGQMLGFHIKENFNYPYCCRSFTDFWRRWHISLSEWFRDYIYIPLGGSRSSIIKNIVTLLVVWILTGMWHGSGWEFIVWGLLYFTMLVLERYLIKPNRFGKIMSIIWRVLTLLIINFNWVIFSHQEGIQFGLQYCLRMIGVYQNDILTNVTDIRLLREYGIYLFLGIIFSTPIAKIIGTKLQQNRLYEKLSVILVPSLYLLAFIWALSFVMLGFHNPFMYQQF